MPGQEELAVVGAGDRQREPVDPRPALVAAVVGYPLRRGDRLPQVAELTAGEASHAAAVAQGPGGKGGGGRRDAHRDLLGTPTM